MSAPTFNAVPNTALGVLNAYINNTDATSQQLSVVAALCLLVQNMVNQQGALQAFTVNYTFTSTDQTNGYAIVSCNLPAVYPDANYTIACQLQLSGGGWVCMGYVAGDAEEHGAAPTATGFNAVILSTDPGGQEGIVAGQTIKISCMTAYVGP